MQKSSPSLSQRQQVQRKQRQKRKGMEAIYFRIGRIWRSISDQPLLALSIVAALAVGISIAIAIITASEGIEKQINVLLGNHSSADFKAVGINIDSIRKLLSQTRDLLKNLAIWFTAALVGLVTWGTTRQRHREISLKRLDGEHVGEVLIELLGEALILCLIGGVLGIALGVALCHLISYQLPLLPMAPTVKGIMSIFPITTILSFCVTGIIAFFFALIYNTEPKA